MKKLFSLIALILVSITLVGCDQTTNITHTASEVMDAVEITFAQGDSANTVTTSLTLPLTSVLEPSANISWESSNVSVIDNFGTVNRQEEDTAVTLVLSVSLGSSSVQKLFDLTVVGTIIYHDVTFNVNGELINYRIVDGQLVNELSAIQLENLRFDGWTTNLTSLEPFDFDDAITEDVTIYAILVPIITGHFTIEVYIENLEDEAYSLLNSASGIAEEGTVKSTNSTMTGFVLNDELSNLSGEVSSENDLLIKSYFDRVDYTLTLMDRYEEIGVVTYKYQESIASVADPVKTGYEFLGWTTTRIGTEYYTFDEVMTSNVILYAQWNFLDEYTYTGYYEGADGLTGLTLETFLRTVVTTGFVGVNYGDARYILDDSDADPNNSNNVILVYRGTSVSGVWDAGITWNREHVWPQSLLGVDADNYVINAASDLHNLKPANPSENSSRSNDYFDDSGLNISYEPRDEVKGDVARILFYMTIRYDYLNLVNSTSPAVYQMAMLDTLLEWNAMDPVDSFEQHRNDVIYSYQHNRNPFIDHPEFVDKIWGTITTSNNDSFYVNLSTSAYLIDEPYILNEEFSTRSYIN